MTVTMDDTNVGSLEDNAAKRKARLAAMKRKLQGNNDDTENNKDGENGTSDESLPAPIFRSYKPTSDELQENTTDITEPTLIEGQIQVSC